jgi:hypothetical protein
MSAERIALIVLSVVAVGFGVIQSSHGESKKLGIEISEGVTPASGHTTVWIIDTAEQTATLCHYEIGKDKVDCHAGRYVQGKNAPSQ